MQCTSCFLFVMLLSLSSLRELLENRNSRKKARKWFLLVLLLRRSVTPSVCGRKARLRKIKIRRVVKGCQGAMAVLYRCLCSVHSFCCDTKIIIINNAEDENQGKKRVNPDTRCNFFLKPATLHFEEICEFHFAEKYLNLLFFLVKSFYERFKFLLDLTNFLCEEQK